MNAKFNEHPIGNPRDSQPRTNYDFKKIKPKDITNKSHSCASVWEG